MKSSIDYALELLDELTIRCPNQEQHRIIFDIRRSLLKVRDEKMLPIRHAGPPGTRDDDLPPIVGSKRKLKSKDVKCPTCFAKPGTECFEMTSRGRHAQPTDVRREDGGVHKQRTVKAREMS